MKTTERMLYWTPRLLAIFFICSMILFSLDVFEPGRSAWQVALGLLMHNIPSIIMIILLVIAWRKEIVGAVSFFAAGLLYIGISIYNAIHSNLPWHLAISWSLTIAGPAIIIGILFLLCWKKSKKIKNIADRNP